MILDSKKKIFHSLKNTFKKWNYNLTDICVNFYSIKLTFLYNNKKEYIYFFKDDFFFTYKEWLKKIHTERKSYRTSNTQINIKWFIDSWFEKLLKELFNKDTFKRESLFLEKFIKKDSEISEKILIYSDEKFLKPIKYLFYYKNFRNIVFYSEENQNTKIKWDYKKVIILAEPSCDLLNKEIKKWNINYDKIIFLWDMANDIYQKKDLEDIILNDDKLEIISNCYKEESFENKQSKSEWDRYIKLKNQFKLCIDKFNFDYVKDFDLFWNIENSYHIKDEVIDTDILISMWWWNRDIEIIYENIDFLKKYKCLFFNLRDFDNPEDEENIKNMRMLNELKKYEHFIFIDRFSECAYKNNIINSKVTLIPSHVNKEYNWRSFTWSDIIMLWKYCLTWKTARLLDFHKYTKAWEVNFDYYENSKDMIEKLVKVLENKKHRNEIEKHAFNSYINDLSIERILYKII